MTIDPAGATMFQIQRLFTEGTVTGLSDAQLIDRFLSGRDGLAFETLLARHGPLVLRACRGVLQNPSDAEDAFQATFMILVRKASSLRGRANIGGWLYLVAYRVAIQANAAEARRRVQERRAGELAISNSKEGRDIPDELTPALHDEVGKLPDKARQAVVLCDLEGLSLVRAAESLRWSERTLRRRLTEGREKLKARLRRRGFEAGSASMAMLRVREATSVVPAPWIDSTVRAALSKSMTTAVIKGTVGSAVIHSQEVLKIMMVQKLKQILSIVVIMTVIAGGGLAALELRGDEPQSKTKLPMSATSVVAARPALESDPLDAVGTFPVKGRVVDPDGKPVADATIYVHHYSFDLLTRATGNTIPEAHSEKVAGTNPDGRFRFDLDKSASNFPYRDFPVWHGAQIAAVAPGFGMTWVSAESLLKKDEALFKLVRDDVPIRGRILDQQGRPVSGVAVFSREVIELDERSRETSLNRGEMGKAVSQYSGPSWIEPRTTDSEGRFEIRGVGRDRVVRLEFRGPNVQKGYLHAMAREGQARTRPETNRGSGMNRPGGPPPALPFVGASFQHVLGPTKPIMGTVKAKGSEKPLAGIQVLATEPLTWTEVSALTDEKGHFELLGLPKGVAYRRGVIPSTGIGPYLSAEVVVPDTKGLDPIVKDLVVPKGVILVGRLVDPATGQPMRAKHVAYDKAPGNKNEGDAELSTSGIVDPTFRITVPPGRGMLVANLRGENLSYLRARLRPADKGKGIGGLEDREAITMPLNAYHAYQMLDIPVDATTLDVALDLTRGDTLKGRLIGPDGKAVLGAKYSGHSDVRTPARSLEGDAFEVLGLKPGTPRLIVFGHEERGLVGWASVTKEDRKPSETLVVRLEPIATIKGRLVDEDGLPMASSGLMAQTHFPGIGGFGPSFQGLWPDDEIWATDAQGRFQVAGVRPGLKVSVHVQNPSKPGFRLDTGDVFRQLELRPGEVRDVGDVTVKSKVR